MARPKTVTDQEILATARRCFIDGGPATSLNTIAQHLGISAAAISKRMGSKNQLLVRCLHLSDWEPPPLRRLREGPRPGPLKPQLVETLDGGFEMLSAQFPTLVALRLSDVELFPDPDRPTPPERVRSALAGWITRAAERDGFDVPSPKVAAALLTASVHSHAFMNWVFRNDPATARPDWDALIEGVLPGMV